MESIAFPQNAPPVFQDEVPNSSVVNAWDDAGATATTDDVSPPALPEIIDENAVVIEITDKGAIEDVAYYPVRFRASPMILYGPIVATGPKAVKYNVIVHHPTSSGVIVSLFRTDDDEKAAEAFILYKEAIPPMMNTDPTLCERDTLEKICQKLWEKKRYNATRVGPYFEYYKLIRDLMLPSFLTTPLGIEWQLKRMGPVSEEEEEEEEEELPVESESDAAPKKKKRKKKGKKGKKKRKGKKKKKKAKKKKKGGAKKKKPRAKKPRAKAAKGSAKKGTRPKPKKTEKENGKAVI